MIEHGKVSVSWRVNTLEVTTLGNFNVEGALKADTQIKTLVMAREGTKHWFRIDKPDINTLGSPEVLAIFSKNYLWSFEHGCKAMALVCDCSMQRDLAKSFVERGNLNIKVFDSVDHAIHWLKCF